MATASHHAGTTNQSHTVDLLGASVSAAFGDERAGAPCLTWEDWEKTFGIASRRGHRDVDRDPDDVTGLSECLDHTILAMRLERFAKRRKILARIDLFVGGRLIVDDPFDGDRQSTRHHRDPEVDSRTASDLLDERPGIAAIGLGISESDDEDARTAPLGSTSGGGSSGRGERPTRASASQTESFLAETILGRKLVPVQFVASHPLADELRANVILSVP